MIWKALFSAVGLGSFFFILQGYGFSRLAADIAGLGWWTIPLLFSFVPTIFCYSMAWLLVTPEFSLSRLLTLHRLTVISVAWNNLSPFVKVLGEPVRVRLLSVWLEPKAAAKSMVLYNIVHLLGTLLSFFLGALMLLIMFPMSKGFHAGFLGLVIAMPLLTLLLYFLPHWVKHFRSRSAHRNRLVVAGFWVRWGFSKVRIFSRQYRARFWLAVIFEIAARFVEGATFYVAFLALEQHVSVLVCSLLDVGRALMDNLFFFIPYQVGSREGGILLLAEDVVRIGAESAVTAAVLYRLVEIFWTGIGYVLWIFEERERKSST